MSASRTYHNETDIQTYRRVRYTKMRKRRALPESLPQGKPFGCAEIPLAPA